MLSDEEQAELIRLAVRQVNDRIPVIAGAEATIRPMLWHCLGRRRAGGGRVAPCGPLLQQGLAKECFCILKPAHRHVQFHPALQCSLAHWVSLTPRPAASWAKFRISPESKKQAAVSRLQLRLRPAVGIRCRSMPATTKWPRRFCRWGKRRGLRSLNIMPSEVKRLCGSFLQGDVSAAAGCSWNTGN